MFDLIDSLHKWIRIRSSKNSRQRNILVFKKKAAAAKALKEGLQIISDEKDSETIQYLKDSELSLKKVGRFLAKIPNLLIAESCFQTDAHARSLLYFEKYVRDERVNKDELDMQPAYEKLSKMYSNLEDADALNGIFTLFANPSLEQQIIHHESTGKWNLAHSCYEDLIRKSPDSYDNKIGILKSLKNLGHDESLLTYYNGLDLKLTHNFEKSAKPYAISASWHSGDWKNLDRLLNDNNSKNFEVMLGRILLAIWKKDENSLHNILKESRANLTMQIAAASVESYQSAYGVSLQLSMLHDIELFKLILFNSSNSSLSRLMKVWDARLTCIVPSLRVRQPILRLRYALLE